MLAGTELAIKWIFSSLGHAENVRVTVFAAWHSLPKSNLKETNHSFASQEKSWTTVGEEGRATRHTGQERNLIFTKPGEEPN